MIVVIFIKQHTQVSGLIMILFKKSDVIEAFYTYQGPKFVGKSLCWNRQDLIIL